MQNRRTQSPFEPHDRFKQYGKGPSLEKGSTKGPSRPSEQPTLERQEQLQQEPHHDLNRQWQSEIIERAPRDVDAPLGQHMSYPPSRAGQQHNLLQSQRDQSPASAQDHDQQQHEQQQQPGEVTAAQVPVQDDKEQEATGELPSTEENVGQLLKVQLVLDHHHHQQHQQQQQQPPKQLQQQQLDEEEGEQLSSELKVHGLGEGPRCSLVIDVGGSQQQEEGKSHTQQQEQQLQGHGVVQHPAQHLEQQQQQQFEKQTDQLASAVQGPAKVAKFNADSCPRGSPKKAMPATAAADISPVDPAAAAAAAPTPAAAGAECGEIAPTPGGIGLTQGISSGEYPLAVCSWSSSDSPASAAAASSVSGALSAAISGPISAAGSVGDVADIADISGPGFSGPAAAVGAAAAPASASAGDGATRSSPWGVPPPAFDAGAAAAGCTAPLQPVVPLPQGSTVPPPWSGTVTAVQSGPERFVSAVSSWPSGASGSGAAAAAAAIGPASSTSHASLAHVQWLQQQQQQHRGQQVQQQQYAAVGQHVAGISSSGGVSGIKSAPDFPRSYAPTDGAIGKAASAYAAYAAAAGGGAGGAAGLDQQPQQQLAMMQHGEQHMAAEERSGQGEEVGSGRDQQQQEHVDQHKALQSQWGVQQEGLARGVQQEGLARGVTLGPVPASHSAPEGSAVSMWRSSAAGDGGVPRALSACAVQQGQQQWEQPQLQQQQQQVVLQELPPMVMNPGYTGEEIREFLMSVSGAVSRQLLVAVRRVARAQGAGESWA